MKSYSVTEEYAGRKLGKYLLSLLPGLKKSLLEKSLRKKNITVNGKKANSSQILNPGDRIEIYFSDETIEKFGPKTKFREVPDLKPVYENRDVLVYNKPAGLLTQGDESGEVSLTDIARGRIGSGDFRPAPLNRLDRNTTGVVIFGKNYKAQRKLSDLLQSGKTAKTYLAIVKGCVSGDQTLKDRYKKRAENVAELSGETEVELNFKPLKSGKDYSLLEIDLKTGKSHQIRAQLAGHGLPIVGDPKYGDRGENEKFKKTYGLDHQLLHASNYAFGKGEDTELTVSAQPDEMFKRIESDLF